MTITIPIQSIQLTPGSSITISNVSWQNYENVLSELGEKRSTRLIYYRGKLELMSPSALHERPHRIIADIVKTILDLQGRDWEDFGSTTFKRPEIVGVEPDTCFYIQNVVEMRGCTNVNLEIYPPPDLAIESDVTSRTTLDAYGALHVPEVWIFSDWQLKIYVLNENSYIETSTSPNFPNLPLTAMIPQLVQEAIATGTSQMLRKLRQSWQ